MTQVSRWCLRPRRLVDHTVMHLAFAPPVYTFLCLDMTVGERLPVAGPAGTECFRTVSNR
jgi:hypothetical protein